MTFLHKLARRLARLKDLTPIAVAAVSLAAAIMGCEQAGTSTQPITPTISQLIVSPKAVTLQPDQLQDFMAVGLLSTGDTAQVDVTWSTSGGSVSATITHGGRHYGQYKSGSCGTYQVTATAHPGNKFDVASVNVACPGTVASVVVSPTSATVPRGQALQLAATPEDSAGNPLSGWTMTWASSNPAVATVDSNGLTSGVAPGSASITAASGGQSGTSTITVTTAAAVPVATVTVSPAAPSVTAGQTVQLSATMKDASGNTLTGRTATWASSNTAATVTSSGLVTGMAAGSATITATSEGQSGASTITVSNVPVASVTVSPSAPTVTVGQTVQLSATTKDASGNTLTGRSVTWVTSNGAVATVSASGLVTAVTAGTATITATSEGKSATAAITVPAPVIANPGTVTNLAVAGTTATSVTLSFTEVSDGTGLPASYDIRYAPGTLSWASATSVPSGTCTTPVAGTSIGAKRTCTVLGLAASTGYEFQLVAFRGTLNQNAVFGAFSNVASGTTSASAAAVASVTVSLASTSVAVGGTDQATAILKDASGNILSGRTITWSSSSTSVATVSPSGLVAGVVAGTATIRATSEGQIGSATVSVTGSSGGGGGVTYYRTNFTDGTTGALDVYAYGGGSCGSSTTYTDPGSAHSIKCTISSSGGAAALQAWFGNGRLSGTANDPSLDQDLFEEVRFVLGQGAAASIGGTSCTSQNNGSQFKTHKSVYGQVGSAVNGWVMSEVGPCSDGNIGMFSEAEMWNINGQAHAWPGTYPSLNEGSVYDVVYRYHRYTAQKCGTIAVWVNGAKVLDSPCSSYMGTTSGSSEGLLFWDGATYLSNAQGTLTVYNLFAQATNYPIGAGVASAATVSVGLTSH